MSRRIEKLSSLIRQILAEAIQFRLQDPRIPTITSITRVEVSEDLSVARVYVSVLESAGKQRACLDALHSSAGHLRWMLGRELSVRKTPLLDFRLDESLQRGFETVELIDRLMASERNAAASAADAEAGAMPAADEAETTGPREDT